jgi:hypothetical protein
MRESHRLSAKALNLAGSSPPKSPKAKRSCTVRISSPWTLFVWPLRLLFFPARHSIYSTTPSATHDSRTVCPVASFFLAIVRHALAPNLFTYSPSTHHYITHHVALTLSFPQTRRRLGQSWTQCQLRTEQKLHPRDILQPEPLGHLGLRPSTKPSGQRIPSISRRRIRLLRQAHAQNLGEPAILQQWTQRRASGRKGEGG